MDKNYTTEIRVQIIEFERGGDSIVEYMWFNTKAEAVEFCQEFNKDNTTEVTPGRFMIAIIQ